MPNIPPGAPRRGPPAFVREKMEQARASARFREGEEGRAKYDRIKALELLCLKPTAKQYQTLDQLTRDAEVLASWMATGRMPGSDNAR